MCSCPKTTQTLKPVEALERRLACVRETSVVTPPRPEAAREEKDRTKGTMGEEKMEVEETTLPEENQEVDASISCVTRSSRCPTLRRARTSPRWAMR